MLTHLKLQILTGISHLD